jgi:hypothetical protein
MIMKNIMEDHMCPAYWHFYANLLIKMMGILKFTIVFSEVRLGLKNYSD